MVHQMACNRSACKQFCSARPVRAPKVSHWISNRQSAAHKPRAVQLACERLAFQSILSHAEGCERQGASRFPFHGPFRHRAVCAVRLPCAKHCSSLGARTEARTAKLRAHGPRAKLLWIHLRGAFGGWGPSGKAIVDPFAWSFRGVEAFGQSESFPICVESPGSGCPMAIQWHRPKAFPTPVLPGNISVTKNIFTMKIPLTTILDLVD